MPTILAIETSVSNASMSLMLSSGEIYTEKFESHRQQNKLLFPALEELLKHKQGHAIDLIIVGTGPGSYSGSRIAIAAAQGLGIAYSCPVVGLCSFLATDTMKDQSTAFAVGDARRDSFFIAQINSDSGSFTPTLYNESDFLEKLATLEHPSFSFEDDIPLFEGKDILVEQPSAKNVIHAWFKLPDSEKEELRNTPPQPAYLRAPFISKAKPGHPLLRKK